MDEQLSNKYDKVLEYCFQLFREKQFDYGPTWLLYRYSSLADELLRKVKRIRTLEEHGDNSLIPEGRDVEYVGIINYCIMFLIRLNTSNNMPGASEALNDFSCIDGIDPEAIFGMYKRVVSQSKDLLLRKNFDYGNAWKDMSLHSMTDQVIIRVYRIRTILKNDGLCKVSEGINAQLQDIINYCFFALLKMETGLFEP
jgi:hypothetical protein